jgi:hypothetical protein
VHVGCGGLNGPDDTHIPVMNGGGVAQGAIQGLNQKMDSENDALRAENAELKQQLDALSRVVIHTQPETQRRGKLKMQPIKVKARQNAAETLDDNGTNKSIIVNLPVRQSLLPPVQTVNLNLICLCANSPVKTKTCVATFTSLGPAAPRRWQNVFY